MLRGLHALVALVMLAPTIAGAASVSEADALEAATAFCAARVAGDEKRTRGLLTAEFRGLVDEALARNGKVQAASPDDKPPLGDGIPWQGFQDAVGLCDAGEVTPNGNSVMVDLVYRFPGQPGGNWTDTLAIVEEDGAAKIDDIFYPAIANDRRRMGLRRVLFDSFDY